MERANDVTQSFLDLRLLLALPVAWLPPWQRANDVTQSFLDLRLLLALPWQQHNLHVSWQPIQISVFLQIEAARPIYGYVQSPDFTAATSSPP